MVVDGVLDREQLGGDVVGAGGDGGVSFLWRYQDAQVLQGFGGLTEYVEVGESSSTMGPSRRVSGAGRATNVLAWQRRRAAVTGSVMSARKVVSAGSNRIEVPVRQRSRNPQLPNRSVKAAEAMSTRP